MEIIKDIKDFEGRYKVSNLGNVYSHYKNGKVLKMKPYPDKQGYLRVELSGRTKMVHRLVATAFIRDIPEGYEVNHLDFNTSNNKLENLEICTPSQNRMHTYKYGRGKVPDNTGSKNGMSKITEQDVLEMRSMFKNGVKRKDIYKKFPKVSASHICTILLNKVWKNITCA